jgi:hypothetical protein
MIESPNWMVSPLLAYNREGNSQNACYGRRSPEGTAPGKTCARALADLGGRALSR